MVLVVWYLLLSAVLVVTIALHDGELSPLAGCLSMLLLLPLIMAAGSMLGSLVSVLFVIKFLCVEGRRIPCQR